MGETLHVIKRSRPVASSDLTPPRRGSGKAGLEASLTECLRMNYLLPRALAMISSATLRGASSYWANCMV